MSAVVQNATSATRSGERLDTDQIWCIDPIRPLRDLLDILGREMNGLEGAGRAEETEARKINVYLLVCAIACSIDDYLAWAPWNMQDLSRRFPRFRHALRLTDRLVNTRYLIQSWAGRRRTAEWRSQWTGCVDAACDALLGGEEGRLRELIPPMILSARLNLTKMASAWRMRIPEGFRCQDLAHHDVVSMVEGCRKYLRSGRPVTIVGPRTAGAYFAPLAASRLRRSGISKVNWITLRPKNGFCAAERRELTRNISSGGTVLVIDDHPNTGNTLHLLISMLTRLGVAPQDLVVTVPGHPSHRATLLEEEQRHGVRLFVLPPKEQYKTKLIASEWAHEQVRRIARDQGWGEIEISDGAETAARNAAFEADLARGFQVRLKRLFDVRAVGNRAEVHHVLAKCTGWGWLGDHAWVAGLALKGFVPPVLRYEQGFLFSEWLEGESAAGHRDDGMIETFASYIACRTNQLALKDDPYFHSPSYRWCGWDDLIEVLARVYGPYLGRIKARGLRKRLAACAAPQAVLIDGRMSPADWIYSRGRFYKTDFEQHNFGGGELDLVDPAWDLASAIFEFRLSRDEEIHLIEAYRSKTGDAAIADRMLLFKILYASVAMKSAKYWLRRLAEAKALKVFHDRYHYAQNFAGLHLARHCAAARTRPSSSSSKLFFLDIDWVLDVNSLGFPHSTPSGIQALNLLAGSGFSVVLNSARSLDQVREYCETYRLAGGVAELGSVYWDEQHRCPIPLIDQESIEQLERMRIAIQAVDSALIEPGYHYSIRISQWVGDRSEPADKSQLEHALRQTGCHSLEIVESENSSWVLAKNSGKGAAIAKVKSHLRSDAPVTAMGDSERDIGMLLAADAAYAPANASRGVRKLVSEGKCFMAKRACAAGLLEVATALSGAQGSWQPEDSAKGEAARLIDELLLDAERSYKRRLPRLTDREKRRGA